MNKLFPIIILVSQLMLPTINANAEPTTERNKNMNTDISNITKSDEAHSFDEYKAVAKALSPYINSATTGNGVETRAAFFDHAHIVGSIGGEFYNLDADQFAEAVSEGGASPNVQHHISWIDISGPAAAAKVDFIDWGGNRFTDFFVLYKHEGEWKISGKVYDSHSNN